MKFTPLMGAVLAASMLTPLAGTAFAEEGDRAARAAERFAEMDANGDGVFTQDEAVALAAVHFEEADADNSGDLSEDEMVAMHRARRDDRRDSRREARDEAREGRHEGRHEGRREGRHEERFARISGDDDLVDLAEFNEGALHRFERADLDENGTVTATELALAHQARRGRRHHGDRDED